MTDRRSFIMLDAGGTFIKSAVMDHWGQVFEGSRLMEPSCSDKGRADIEGAFARVIGSGVAFAQDNGLEVAGVGIAIPGPFDYGAGVSGMTHKFGGIRGIHLRDVIRMRTGLDGTVPIMFMSDVNAALEGELSHGNASGFPDTALVTLGTGLGFAYSRDGKVQCSPGGGPAEVIYNLPYRDGILEDYASKRGFLNVYHRLSGDSPHGSLTVAALGRLCSEGDRTALSTFAAVGGIIAEAVKGIMDKKQIQCLLFGGQISGSFEFMRPAVVAGLRDLPHLTRIDRMAHLGDAPFHGLLHHMNQNACTTSP